MADGDVVLDTSAVIALLCDEDGADTVACCLNVAVNLRAIPAGTDQSHHPNSCNHAAALRFRGNSHGADQKRILDMREQCPAGTVYSAP